MSDPHYLVTARKYRPQVFADLVAQEHVSETLKNAIRLNRLAHLYLFSGPRGVGKTTAARILAKAINCTAPADQRIDSAEPCRSCDSCHSFEEGRSLSIFEIDAASNNKADDMRELRDTVRIPPQGGKRKVYIVDEVHMLSSAAFNVLLKTLEEPPPYVLFIFATTEPHKVLPTILSRCQRFDFKRIPVDEIVERLSGICADEGISADDASLMLIARKGDGALRDALSVFDQAVALCGDTLRYDELAQALGVVDVDVFFRVTDAATGNDTAAMLHIVDEVVRSGHDFQEFLGGLAEHLRSLLITTTTGDAALIEGIDEIKQRYLATGKRFDEADLLRMLMIVATAESDIRGSTHPRLRLELALLKIAALTSTRDLRSVIARMERGEHSGGPPAAHVAEPSAPATARPAAPAPQTAQSRRASASPRTESSVPPPEDPPDEPLQPSSEPDAPVRPPANDPPPSQPAPRSEPLTDIRSRVFSEPALKIKRRRDDAGPSADLNGDGADVLVAEFANDVSIHELRAAWEAACLMLSEDRVRVCALMRQSTPRAVDVDVLIIEVPSEFHRRELENVSAVVLSEVARSLDRSIEHLRCIVPEKPADQGGSETADPTDPYEYLQQKRQENETLRSLFEDFGGEFAA